MLQDNNINQYQKQLLLKLKIIELHISQDNQEYTTVWYNYHAAGFKPKCDQLGRCLEEIYDDVTVIGDAKAPRKF